MKPFVVVSESTGEVLRSGSCRDDDFDRQAGPGESVRAPNETFNQSVNQALDGEGFVALPTKPGPYHRWNSSALTWQPDTDAARRDKVIAINKACAVAITGGFTSLALGAAHVYDSEETDQINLIGQRERATLTGEAQHYKCREVATGIKGWRPHTAAQLNQVFLDGAAFKEKCLVAATGFKASIAGATTLDEILAVVWVDPV